VQETVQKNKSEFSSPSGIEYKNNNYKSQLFHKPVSFNFQLVNTNVPPALELQVCLYVKSF